MRIERPALAAARLCAVVTALGFAACSQTEPAPTERVGTNRAEVFANGDFEIGAAGISPPSWTVSPFLNNTGVTIQNPQTRAGLNLAMGGKNLTTQIAAAAQTDPDLGAGASLRLCRFGAQCARVNFHSSNNFGGGANGNAKNVNSLSQTMTVAAADVDPADSQVHVRFAVAPVLQNPGHAANLQPYYMVQLTNVTKGNALLYSDFNLSAQPGVPWKTVNGGTANEIDYVDWSLVDIAPGNASLAVGDQILLEIIAGGCQPGGHFGEIYVDGVGSTIPGLFVSGTGPQQANAGSNIVYNFNYKNGSAASESMVVIDFTTPPNTTFQGITPPVGATCVTPAIGATGTIVCTFTNPVAAGVGGAFNITVNINPGTTTPIVCGTYDIKSAQESPLIGNKITTIVGCAVDTDCLAGNWCHESAVIACLPTLPNGTPIPSDPPHVNPTLNGGCTAQAGALVCTSGVCDGADNKCGFLNGDGPCSVANGGVVCRSGVCDPDQLCGYANGDGPCTLANGGVVCRSGACSVNGLCEPAGGCNVDGDCAPGNWCNEQVHTCTPTLPNGTQIPSDPPHANPTLNGTCSVASGALVCTSGVCDGVDDKCGFLNGDGSCNQANGGVVCRSQVCDPDGKCGYANGDGPCDQGSATVVCRSQTCSVNGLCEPAGGCNVDADCMNGNWCDETNHACTPKLVNGTALPVDAPHTNPTLDGTCTQAASTLVCVSAVCDVNDNKCGFANGDGPCDMNNAMVVCRSGVCSMNGICVAAGGCNVDADCTGTDWCNEAAHMCTPALPNGTSLPTDVPHTNPTLDGKCTQGAGTLVCESKVCDVNDDKCGFANGDGPCDMNNAMVVCRSGACSVDGTCMPALGCNTDGDCSKGNWCDEAAHKCTPQLPNGDPIPTDMPHKNPTLDGKCTMESGALVCASLVCDTQDDKCGFANGDGPCTDMTGPTVCRSTICATTGANTGKCVECVMDSECKGQNEKCDLTTNTCSVGCKVDSDCPKGDWCNETAATCTPKLANGQPVPTDPAHTSPTLDGMCTPEAGALVCESGVCDAKDNKCGIADGDGPCANNDECRNLMCDMTRMICGSAPPVGCTTDGDCTPGNFCDATHACAPKLPDGTACGGGNQCQSDFCNVVCDSIVAEGNGILCATTPGNDNGSPNAALALLGLVVAARVRRKR